MKINSKRTSINVEAKKVSQVGKLTGLMFKPAKTQSLLFEFNKKRIQLIHSYFVFFTFLAVWLDEENTVVDYRIVKPFVLKVSSGKPVKKLVEIPFNQSNRRILDLFVDKRKDLNIHDYNLEDKNKKGGENGKHNCQKRR